MIGTVLQSVEGIILDFYSQYELKRLVVRCLIPEYKMKGAHTCYFKAKGTLSLAKRYYTSGTWQMKRNTYSPASGNSILYSIADLSTLLLYDTCGCVK